MVELQYINIDNESDYNTWEKLNVIQKKQKGFFAIGIKVRLEDFSTQQITDIRHKINKRPREKIMFNNPKNIFYKLVA